MEVQFASTLVADFKASLDEVEIVMANLNQNIVLSIDNESQTSEDTTDSDSR